MIRMAMMMAMMVAGARITTIAAAAIVVDPVDPCRIDSRASTIFYDMHDGDMKSVTLDSRTVTITPHGNSEKWTVTAALERNDGVCSATVDFNVPGKPNPPPFKLSMQLFSAWGYGKTSSDKMLTTPTWQFTKAVANPSSADSDVLNAWVSYPPVNPENMSMSFRCPTSGKLVARDMGDGDEKIVTIEDGRYRITSADIAQKWVVEGAFDTNTCAAMVDFRVPGKPNPPPCSLRAQVWLAISGPSLQVFTVEFTDPTDACQFGEPGSPLNLWINQL